MPPDEIYFVKKHLHFAENIALLADVIWIWDNDKLIYF